MKKRVKLVLIALIVIIAAIFGVYNATRPPEVDIIIISPMDAHMYFIQQGYGAQGRTVSVYPLLGGEILSTYVREGDRIQAGDIICRIDTSGLELAIMRSETNITALEAQMRNLRLNENRERNALRANRSDLLAQREILDARSYARDISVREQINLQEAINRQLESALEHANRNYESMRVLYELDAISREELNAAISRAEDAESALEQGILALAGVHAGTALGTDEYFEAARAAIDVQISSIDRSLAISYISAMEDYFSALIDSEHLNIATLNRDIENGIIRAPISGRIERFPAADLNIASPNMPIAVIRTDDELAVEVFVRTRDVINLSIGEQVDVIFRARGENIVFQGTITEIGERAEERISPLGIAERNVKVTVQIPENDIIRDGYDVDVRFTYFRDENRMIVPRTALFSYGGRDMLWVVENERAEMREVTLGAELRTQTVVEAGIEFGDIIVRDANDNRLREGVGVRW